MKVLLDENIDVRLKRTFDGSGHDVRTVKDMGWNGLKNGELLHEAADNGFDVLVAVDKNLPYQQNLGNLPVSIFVLDVKRNVLSSLLPIVPSLLAAWAFPLEKKVYLISE